MAEIEADQLARQLSEGLAKIFGDASTASVFSEPAEAGDSMVITAAAWERAGGFGFGSGRGSDGGADEGEGSGGGGGGTAQVRPVAVITVGPGGTDVKPVIDFTKIGVTMLLAAVGVWRMLRR